MWLPPYHCELNPIELLWAYVKRKVRDKATTKSRLAEIKELSMEVLQNVPSEIVQNFDRHVREKEDWFWKEEGIQGPINPFLIDLDENDSLGESESEDNATENEMEDYTAAREPEPNEMPFF